MKPETIREIFGKNLKFLRKREGWTQARLVEELALKISEKSISSYENGESFPDPETISDILYYFGYPYEAITQLDFEQESTALEQYRAGGVAAPQVQIKPFAVTVDRTDREVIVLVPEKAAAGYARGFSDPSYVQRLEGFSLPWLPENGSYRAFELSGDSMLPLSSGTVVVGKYIESPREMSRGERYIVVTTDGIVYKRVYLNQQDSNSLLLVSDNALFEPYELRMDQVRELWETYAIIETKGRR